MLNPFPIQFLALLAHALLRIFVGGALVYLAHEHFRFREELRPLFGSIPTLLLSGLELISGVMFILGFYTQIAALLSIALSLIMMMGGAAGKPHVPERLFYVLLFAASLSLFVTGAGAPAFDLPI